MEKSNCCVIFCVEVTVFMQIVGGLCLFVLSLVYNQELGDFELVASILASKVSVTSGVFLLRGLTQAKPELVYVHIVLTVISMVLIYFGFTIKFFMVTMRADVAIIVFSIFAGLIIFLGVMEYGVYLFYKNIKSESERGVNV